MEELELQERPGFFSKFSGLFNRSHDEYEEEAVEAPQSHSHTYQLRQASRYHVSIRKDIESFDDAYAAANGLKRGEQQVINLSRTDPILRQKIVDFMAGVAFSQEANWEEVGEHIYLVAPASAFVEIATNAGSPTPMRTSPNAFFSN